MSALAVVPEPDDEEENTAPAGYEFDEDFQEKIVALSLRDVTFCTRTEGLIKPEFLVEEADQHLLAIGQSFYKRYRTTPGKGSFGVFIKDEVVNKRVRADVAKMAIERYKEILKTDIADRDFVIDKVAEFARHRAVEAAIIQSVYLKEKGDFENIIKSMREAVDVGENEEGGDYDFFEEADNRAQKRLDIIAGKIKKDGITSGIPELDKYLYHGGWGRKELSLYMGAAKAGKSMGLHHHAIMAALAGFNVLDVTLEVSADIVSERIEAAVTDIAVNQVKDKPLAVKTQVQALKAKAGKFKLREYASGTMKPSHLRRIIEGYRAKGITFDLIVVDYADIMCPEFRSNDRIEDMRTIYVDLRAIAFEYNVAVLTATQTNREGAKKQVATMTDVAEDFNKIRTADIVLSINSTQPERDAGEARIFFAASRNTEDGFVLRIKQSREKMQFIKKVLGRE